MDDQPVFERFLSLAVRELKAEDVRLLSALETPPEAPNVLVTRLPDGRHVVASFAEAPADRDALERRLAMLVSTFAEALSNPGSERTRAARPPVATSLHEELKALAARARAIDVVVIDIDSPVVWGCASSPARPRARTDLLLRDVSDRELSARVLSDDAHETVPRDSAPFLQDPASTPDLDEPAEPEVARRAVAAVRALPAIDLLHKGKHLRHVARDGDYYLALSFSGIYVLLLVFDDAFDELRAERAAQDAVGRIERLVLALPPLDPEPQATGGVIALRPRRR